MDKKILLQTMRPSFLVLTPVCVFLGLSASFEFQLSVNIFLSFLVLIGALTAHISVNMLNEFYDFKSGLDLKTEKTPFSGGSGALPDHPEMAASILIVGLISLMVTLTIGIYFIMERGIQILPIGIVGVLLVATYTQWLNRSPYLCLISPGLGFGVLMVMGTHVILTGEYSLLSLLIALVPFFLVNNLLLLNQYPDIKADSSVGRNTFPIAFGIIKSNFIYGFFMMAAVLLILFLIVSGRIPSLSYISLVPMLFSLYAMIGAIKYTSNIGRHPRYMAANVVASILTPFLLGLSIIAG